MRRSALPLVLLALACPTLLRAAPPQRPCLGIAIRSLGESKLVGTEFSANTTDDLVFSVRLSPQLTGDHMLELRFLTPRGHLYQSIAVPIASTAADRSVHGYARPVKAQVLKPVRRRGARFLQADQPLPVGGTLIQTNSLYGLWKVEAYLDGRSESCSVRSFTINP